VTSTADVIAALDRGEIRVAERRGDDWVVNEEAKAAILDYFRERTMEPIELGPFEYHDKIPLKHDYAARGGEVLLERDLVVVLERADLQGLRGAQPEKEQNGLLDPAMRHPGLGALLGDSKPAPIELGERAFDGAPNVRLVERARSRIGLLDDRGPAREDVVHRATAAAT